LAWWPGRIEPGRVDSTPSQFHDWMPTFAELAGVLAPARSDGVSLVPTLTRNRKQTPGTIYVEYAQNGKTKDYQDFGPSHRGQTRGQMQVIHVDGFKGVRVNIQSHDDPFQIYNLQQDPQERTNLADSSDRFRELQETMKDRVLQLRRPDASAPRPYDDVAVPSVTLAAASQVTPGLHWRTRSGAFAYVPNLSEQTPSEIGTVDGIAIDQIEVAGGGAIELSGWIEVPSDGQYRFALSTSRGAVLRLHAATVIDADAGYAALTQATGTIRLRKGHHPIRLTCLKSSGEDSLQLRWALEDAELQPIAAELLSH